MKSKLSLQQGWNEVPPGKAASILLYYTTSVSQISIPLESTRWRLPLVWLQTHKTNPANPTSIHHSAHGARMHLQLCNKPSKHYLVTGHDPDIKETINPIMHQDEVGRMEEGKASLDLTTSEMTTVKCDPALRLRRSKVASVLLNRWHNWMRCLKIINFSSRHNITVISFELCYFFSHLVTIYYRCLSCLHLCVNYCEHSV